MAHQDGVRVSLVDESMLDATGILQGKSGCTKAYGLTDEAVRLFLLIASAGEDGLTQSKIPKELREQLNEHLIPLELQELVAWERDKRGRKAYLVLTWKGQEAIAAARPAKQTNSRISARRRAVNGGVR
ncbi:6-phosphogluconolactonase [Novimethylophilus kurashikiensis]|uniref:6-phosphogluconolactonase n=1 Tax=Novimethylophilus kurashikiensis TaxID=1825523 RepID=A0A2R5FAE5_9PROT|nr:hypothetical protein [Novimethylophilus kurashikiensis]GBG14518.1 6-phosphogluconolactonase [Novimethylophilus kurashikiensis]